MKDNSINIIYNFNNFQIKPDDLQQPAPVSVHMITEDLHRN